MHLGRRLHEEDQVAEMGELQGQAYSMACMQIHSAREAVVRKNLFQRRIQLQIETPPGTPLGDGPSVL
jgi:hypothetical protein